MRSLITALAAAAFVVGGTVALADQRVAHAKPASLRVVQVTGSPAYQCGSAFGACVQADALATCPKGSVVVSGGYHAESYQSVRLSEPQGNSWRVVALNRGSDPSSVTATVVCAIGAVSVQVG
jgi:hypothetical protein